jgi:hypothetical protein
MAGERPSTTPAGASTTPMRSNLRTFMRMITGGSTSTNIPRQKHGIKRMLTSGQLSDLFRRLDRDGNGELDLEEFTQIISKMKINATEEFITRCSLYLLAPINPFLEYLRKLIPHKLGR